MRDSSGVRLALTKNETELRYVEREFQIFECTFFWLHQAASPQNEKNGHLKNHTVHERRGERNLFKLF